MLQAPNNLIGPHEGRELELMLIGTKPAALISYETFKLPFKPYVISGQFCWAEVKHCGSNFIGQMAYSAIFTQIGQEWRINSIAIIYERVRKRNHMSNWDHYKLGQLLGYSEEQILAFLERQI